MPDLLPVAEAQVVRSSGSTVYIWHPAPGVLVNRAQGVLTEAAAQAMLVSGQRAIASDGKIVTFQDWEELTTYERAARVQMTKVGAELSAHVEMNHYLVRARMLALGLQIASIVLRNIKVHPTRASLESTLRATIAARTTRARAS